MWSHWVYKNEAAPDLEQGDVLKRTEPLVELLRTYHPYYADHPENRFYFVLTQSCDLVRRGAPCNAGYIALAPIRPLKAVIHREFDGKLRKIDSGDSIGSFRLRSEVERFLGRLFNNNEPSYYFLEEEASAGLSGPMCASLALSISLKAEHYQTFLDARLIGIKDEFQAKLGWLIGQQYSRVGTRDYEAGDLKRKVDSIAETLALWLEPSDMEHLEGLIRQHREQHREALIDKGVIESLVAKIPKKKAMAIEQFLEIATRTQIIATPSAERRKLRMALENDAKLAALFK